MSYLDKILDATRARVDAQEKLKPRRELEGKLEFKEPPRDFLSALEGTDVALIAEFKRRSPSAGVIREGLEPADVARAYKKGGASALSILTEPEFFSGSMRDLASAKMASSLPVLRKDFVIDPYQILEARVYGADAVLLIVGAFTDEELLRELKSSVEDHSMTALIEVHDEAELERAIALEPSVIGVNQRDLKTFQVDTSLAPKLRKLIPDDVLVVAESGINSHTDVELLENAGVEAMLVGEHLMRSLDIAAATADLLGRKS